MKLSKALKVKKSLIGEITKLKRQIAKNNSFLVGSKNGENFKAKEKKVELMKKISELTNLKYIINEANAEIQAEIYMLSEYKALVAFWQGVNVTEGKVEGGGFHSTGISEYDVHFNEGKKDEIIKEYQVKVDALQDKIDFYNFTTEILIDEEPPKEDVQKKQ